jgi:radical SAM protein with 4Fe4S-binding SPASM domain
MKNKFSHLIALIAAKLYFRDSKYINPIERVIKRMSIADFFRESLVQLNFIAGGKKSSFAPRNVRFEVSSICNLKCLMCPQPRKMIRAKKLLDFSLFKKILDNNPQIKEVDLFNWGEPLVHPDFVKFVSYAAAKNIYTRTITNAILLTPEKSKEIIEAGLNEIIFSIDSTGDNYKKIRGVPFEKTMENVKNFVCLANEQKCDILISVNITKSKFNAGHLESIVSEISALGVGDVNLNECQEYSGGYKRVSKCVEPYRYLVVLSNGQVTPCCVDYDGELAFGSIYNEIDLKKLYNSQLIQKLRLSLSQKQLRPKICATCTYRVPLS